MDAELDQVTAGIVRVGSAASGGINVTALITQGAGYSTLSLLSGGNVVESGGGSLAVSNLRVDGPGVNFGNSANAVTTLAGVATGDFSTAFLYVQSGALTIGDVDGAKGVSATLGGVSITTNATITLASLSGLESIRSGTGAISTGITLTAAGATSDVIATTNIDALSANKGNTFVSAGRDILLGTTGVDFDNDVRGDGSITLSAGRDVTINGFSDVVSDDFGNNTGGNVLVIAGNDINVLGSDASIGAGGSAHGQVQLIAGADRFLNLSALGSEAVFSTSGVVHVTADRVAVAAGSGITAATGYVEFQPLTSGRLVTLGSTTDVAGSTLELSDAELDRIFAPELSIGNGSTGAITITDQISSDGLGGHYDTLSLFTGAGIFDAFAGVDLAVNKLALHAGTGIGVGDAIDTAVKTLAFVNASGNVNISNTGALTIGAVDGLASSSNAGGATTISAASPLTFASDMSSVGTAIYTAGEANDPPTFADDLTINSGVTVSVTTGDLILRAGDEIVFQSGAKATASGTVFLTAGDGDLDGDGAILASSAAGADITGASTALSAITGIGTAAAPLETQVGTLEGETATGGIFIENGVTTPTSLAVGGGSGALAGLRITDATATGDLRLINHGSINAIVSAIRSETQAVATRGWKHSAPRRMSRPAGRTCWLRSGRVGRATPSSPPARISSWATGPGLPAASGPCPETPP
jgi:hypothetical protein